MTMLTKWREDTLDGFIVFSLVLIICCYHASAYPERGHTKFGKLYIEPTRETVSAGENVTVKCSYPSNVTFKWQYHHDLHPFRITNGRTTQQDSGNSLYWSEITFLSVPKLVPSLILCLTDEYSETATAFLTVNGIKYGDACHSSSNCVTDKATCLTGVCACPQNNVLLRLAESGYEVCRELIYKLYDPCEFSEQCYNLVDSKSICGSNGICTCAPWASDVNGKCVSKSEITYNRSQEMYRVGLIAVTCIIIAIVAVSLWITLRRSCQEQNSVSQRNSLNNGADSGHPTFSISSLYDATSDKPPSYDDVLETSDTVGASPPDFKDALKHSITARKLLRQSSAPAGQLLNKTTSLNTSPYFKTGYDSPVFSHNES